MKSAEIRERFLRYFGSNDHEIVPSSSLVPANDPTLLFTNAGMNQFKDTFLGLEPRPYTMATSSQKCMRVSGKHNDLENVGPSPRHHTFFEMLGNFSFGDYFKQDAIRFAWELLTEEFQLDPKRLWVTVYEGDAQVPADQEAERYWQETGVPRERILRFGAKDNFWQMGDTGPCGPCSEIHYYQGDDVHNQTPLGVNNDDTDEYLEIWNLVFMQYNRDEAGTLTPLPKPSIDTGMGFERLVAVLQGVRNNYETDLFTPLIDRLIALVQLSRRDDSTGRPAYEANRSPYHAIADHTRACAFLIADGVRPGNEGRNYVLRRILRRAAYQGQTIGLTEPFLAQVVDEVIAQMGDAYPELRTKADYIKQIVTAEEEQFGRTLQRGLTILESLVTAMQRDKQTIMVGDAVFDMHDTYGFPPDLTAKILSERNLGIDEAGYHAAREQQRARGRQAAQFRRGAQAELWTSLDLPQTTFTGYTELQTPGRVLMLVANGEQVQDASEGEQVQIVLDQTCFYAESGGQVGDMGVLRRSGGTSQHEQALVRIGDVQKPVPGVYVHSGTVERGTLAVGDTVEAQVDGDRRRDIMRNHTATHLLHRALRDVLGSHAEQAGSLVAPDRLRFDFGHGSAIAAEDLREIERRVNAWVRADTEVNAAQMPIAEARAQGAMALFGEKYGDVVRVVTIGCDDVGAGGQELGNGSNFPTPNPQPPTPGFCSRELCGGTHVGRTGEIGYFRIANESSIGSGLRRIEALTGAGAEQYVTEQSEMVREAARRLNTAPAQLLDRIEQIQAQIKQQQQQIAQLERGSSTNQLDTIMERRQQQDGVTFVAARVDAASADKLRTLGDQARAKIGSGVVVLGSVINDKPQLLAMVTPDLVSKGYHAGILVKALAQHVGGGGGGRADVAQAGGRDVSKLDAALGDVGTLLAKQA